MNNDEIIKNDDKIYDIIIVGGGAAGISAAIYAKRAGRDVLVLEKVFVGGQLNLIGEIENYAGFPKISGNELADKFKTHAKSLDILVKLEEVVDYKLDGTVKEVVCKNHTYKTRAVILALGSHPRELQIDGEKQFLGRGVSYCALCDGNFFKDKDVAVVGSGDSAFSDAMYLSNICNKVYVLTKSYLKLHNYTENDLQEKKNVEILKNALSKNIEGNDKLEKLTYTLDGQEKSLNVDAVFVAIGRKPDTEILKDKLSLNPNGYIITNDRMQTSVEGVFACGDVRENMIKQIATAVGEGAIAGTEANKYILKLKGKKT